MADLDELSDALRKTGIVTQQVIDDLNKLNSAITDLSIAQEGANKMTQQVGPCPHGFSSAAWCKQCKDEAKRRFDESVAENAKKVKHIPPRVEVQAEDHGGIVGLMNSSLVGSQQLGQCVVRSDHATRKTHLDIPHNGRMVTLSINDEQKVNTKTVLKAFGRIGDPFMIAFMRKSNWDMQCPTCLSHTPIGSEVGKCIGERYPNGKWICANCIVVAVLMAAGHEIGVVQISAGKVNAALATEAEEAALSKLLKHAVDPDDLAARVKKLRRQTKKKGTQE